jgi:predicted nucleic acid-binding protein
MAYFLDTNIFLRLVNKSDPDRLIVIEALRKLKDRKEEFYFSSQVLAEFWNVCTRPVTARSGLGLSSSETDQKTRIIERYCKFLPDTLATHQEWRRLIHSHQVKGVEVHDTRIIALMKVYQIGNLLTLNVRDFNRFNSLVTVFSPQQVL